MVASVGICEGTFAAQRHMIGHPSNYVAGEPPSLATLNDVEGHLALSYCTPAILDEILVPPGCQEEEFLQQWKMVQKLYHGQLRECRRRCFWTAQFHMHRTHQRSPVRGPDQPHALHQQQQQEQQVMHGPAPTLAREKGPVKPVASRGAFLEPFDIWQTQKKPRIEDQLVVAPQAQRLEAHSLGSVDDGRRHL
eukprot:jgi/Mesen1/169/ME1133381C07628